MNTKIFQLVTENLKEYFKLPKYSQISINATTVVNELPWTPARFKKFKDHIESEIGLELNTEGTVSDIVRDLDNRYLLKFFGEIWKPRTDDYIFTGWKLAEDINRDNPTAVLDVGCGYHPFKGRIPNIVGIDPYNNCADYQVDILEYRVKPGSYSHIIALGSINFNSRDDIEERFSHCINLLAVGGKMYLRANPGITHKNGPYVDIFPWTFEVAHELAEKYNLKLLEFKKDTNNRLFFVYQK